MLPRKAVSPFQYAAGALWEAGAGELAPGVYYTAINVHNPSEHGVRFRKKVALAGRGEKPGRVSRFFDAKPDLTRL